MRNELHSDQLRLLGSEGEVHDRSIFVDFNIVPAHSVLCMHLSPSTNKNNNNQQRRRRQRRHQQRKTSMSKKWRWHLVWDGAWAAISNSRSLALLMPTIHHLGGISYNATSPSRVRIHHVFWGCDTAIGPIFWLLLMFGLSRRLRLHPSSTFNLETRPDTITNYPEKKPPLANFEIRYSVLTGNF